MALDLNLLNCFRHVAEQGSISAATNHLHLSQPAISLQIQRLEEQIGRKLFERHNRGLMLTKFGRQFLENSIRLLEVQRDLESLVQSSEPTPRGRLKVGTYTTASSYLIAEAATKFLRAYPEVSLCYSYEDSRTLLEKIKDHRLDCAILTDVPETNGLSIVPFYKDELVYALSTKRKEAKTKLLAPSDLSKVDFLSYPLRYDLCYKTVEAKFGAHLTKARVVVETESFDTLKQMLLQGAGGTFIPRYLIHAELKAGKLVAIPVGQTKLPIEFSFITKKDSELSKATELFKEAILRTTSGVD